MSVIELSWTAKKLQLPSIKLDEPKSLYSTNTISEVWEKYTFPNFGAVPGSRQMLILQERNMIQGSKQIQTSLSPILVQLKQEKSSFAGFFILENQHFVSFSSCISTSNMNITCYTSKWIRILCRFRIWPLKCHQCLRFWGILTFLTTTFIHEFVAEILTLSEKEMNFPRYFSED